MNKHTLIYLFPVVVQKKGRFPGWGAAKKGCLSLSRRVRVWGLAPQKSPVNIITVPELTHPNS